MTISITTFVTISHIPSTYPLIRFIPTPAYPGYSHHRSRPFQQRRRPRFSQLRPPAAQSPARSPWSSPGPGATTFSERVSNMSNMSNESPQRIDLGAPILMLRHVTAHILWSCMEKLRCFFLRDGSFFLAFVHGN